MTNWSLFQFLLKKGVVINMGTFGFVLMVLYILYSVEVALCRIRRNEAFWRDMDSVPYGDLEYYYGDVEQPSLFGIDCFIFFPSLVILGIYLILCKVF